MVPLSSVADDGVRLSESIFKFSVDGLPVDVSKGCGERWSGLLIAAAPLLDYRELLHDTERILEEILLH
jgi:hypothetical protein